MIADILSRLRGQREAAVGALDALEAMRAQIDDAKAEIARIESAPQPLEDAMAQLDAWMERQATAAVDALPIGRLLDRTGAGRGLDREPVVIRRHAAGEAGGHVSVELGPEVDVLRGLMMASPTVRAELRDVVAGQLRDRLNGRETMDGATRRKKLDRAMQALLDLEMVEEASIRALEAAGLPVMRRPDADARALLAADTSLPEA
ncbi:hypothetical protein [Cereibacter azotoformans]|uniref:hypothetical protein n=1 Tax=Cereibacter azotoformans TaxID=43057 RepID=UPI000C6E55B1|nr:hypothetical protein [Cereibacter azotoformans]